MSTREPLQVYVRDGMHVLRHAAVRKRAGMGVKEFDKRVRRIFVNLRKHLLGAPSHTPTVKSFEEYDLGWTEAAIDIAFQEREIKAALKAVFTAARLAPEPSPVWVPRARGPEVTVEEPKVKQRSAAPNHQAEETTEAEIIPPEAIASGETVEEDELAAAQTMPIVFNRDQETLTTSLLVAKVYKRRHDNVLAKIRLLLRSLNLRSVFVFRETSYIDTEGVSQPMFEMNEQAFILLVSGFTGADALKLRVSYIVEFERMKQALRAQVAQPQDFNDPAILRQILIGYTYQLEVSRAETADERARRIIAETKAAAETERALQQEEIAGRERVAREAAEAEKVRMAPKAEYFDDLVSRIGLYTYTDAARMLSVQRNYLITILLNPPLKWHFRFNHSENGRLIPYQSTCNAGYMAVQSKAVPHPEDGHLVNRETARLTEKGIEFLRQYLKGGPFKLVS